MQIKKVKTIEDFIEMEQLELKYYSEQHVTPYKEAYLWHLSNPMTGFVLEDNGKIIAFSDILPIKQEVFDQVLRGTLNDKYLTTADLIHMEELKEGDIVNLILSCIVVHEDYRKTDALDILLNAHLDYYRDFVKKGICIETVLTSNVTKAGERFSERMRFERIGRSEHQTTLYRTSFQQFDGQVKNIKNRLEEQLLRYEKLLLDQEFCKDERRLNDLISEDFLEYGQSGTIYNRETLISLISCERDTNADIVDFAANRLDNHVIIVHYTAIYQGKTVKKSLRTSIWRIEDGQWKLYFHQGTEIKG